MIGNSYFGGLAGVRSLWYFIMMLLCLHCLENAGATRMAASFPAR